MQCRFFNLAPICFALLAAVLLAGCGKKTPPVPPQTVLPAPIQDLRYELNEKGVTLRWTYPTRTVQGERLPYRIKEFELYRAVMPEKDYCPGCPITFEQPVTIKAEPSEADKTVSFTEALLRPGQRYVYEVRSKAGWYVTSNASNTVSFFWNIPPGAPSDLKAEAGDRSVSLSWQPPQTYIDGSPISGPIFYQVYRAIPNEDFLPLGDKVSATTYTDNTAKIGIKYSYRVRAVRKLDDTNVAGPPSSIQSGVPKDLTAPPPPQNITVVGNGEGVKIFWQAVSAPDLAGYRIYRRAANMKEMQFVGEVGPSTLTFIDKSPLAGSSVWLYGVTSFDTATPPNESGFAGTAELRVSR